MKQTLSKLLSGRHLNPASHSYQYPFTNIIIVCFKPKTSMYNGWIRYFSDDTLILGQQKLYLVQCCPKQITK